MLNKPHVVTGYNEDGNIVLHDMDSFDADSVKQLAYDSHKHYLENAYKRDAVSSYGPWKEGGECTLNGAPGHIINGECIPDDPSENHASDARDAGWQASCAYLRDAWKR